MSFASQSTQQKLPFAYDEVFADLTAALAELRVHVEEADRSVGRITASTDRSLLSWGENITVTVERLGEKSSRVSITSSLKVSLNVGGADRHQRNFNDIIAALSRRLFSRSVDLAPQ
jgi:hypothetical protein